MDVAGRIVPVSIGRSSLSDTEAEVERILNQMDALDQSQDEGLTECSDDEVQVSSPDLLDHSTDASDEEFALLMNEERELYADDIRLPNFSARGEDILQVVDEIDGYQPDDEWSSSSDNDNNANDDFVVSAQPVNIQQESGGCPTWQVTRTASRPHELVDQSLIREGVSCRADVGGGTRPAAEAIYDQVQSFDCDLLVSSGLVDEVVRVACERDVVGELESADEQVSDVVGDEAQHESRISK